MSRRPPRTGAALAGLAALALAGCGSNPAAPGPGSGAWRQVDTELLNGIGVTAVGSRLLAASVDGLLASDDDGATWSKPLGTPPLGYLTDLATVGTSVLAASDEGLFLSTDQGTSFAPVAAVGLPTSVGIYTSIVVGGDLLVGMNTPSQDPGITGGLFRTSDAGATFTASSTGLPQDRAVPSLAIGGGALYCSFVAGVGRSTDAGVTWQPSTLPGPGNVLQVAAVGGEIVAGTSLGTIFGSPDGVTFSAVGAGLPAGAPIDVLYENAGNLYASTPGNLTVPPGVLVSTDGATSFAPLNDGFGATPPYVVAFVAAGGYLVGVTESAGIWRRAL
jgi:hypothetical protein